MSKFCVWSGRQAMTVFLFLILSTGAVLAGQQFRMYVGEVKVMQIGRVQRVAIGNPKVASNSILPNGQLVLLADNPGVTSVHIWLDNGREETLTISVLEKKKIEQYGQIARLFREIPGISTIRMDDLVVVKGQLPDQEKERFSRILDRYKGDILNLATPQDHMQKIRELLSTIPNIEVRPLDDRLAVTGEVNKKYAALLDTLAHTYPSILNLTRTQNAIAGKMVYMKVRIMEVGKNMEDKLGINWADAMTGPSFQFGVEVSQDRATILNDGKTSDVLKKTGKTSLTTASGYFGIATGITSVLNLLETTGDAVSLAEPMLSTRSGGKAEFLAGGEYPMPMITAQGQTTVQFKKYGIGLQIEPYVDDHGTILAHVETEVSDIDKTYLVSGIPGIITRKTSTDISMHENETLVIAGLLKEKVSKDYDNVKWLSDIPVLGALFRSKDYQNDRTELLIFVTPRIYDVDSEINRKALQKVEMIRDRFKEITDGAVLME